MQQFSRLASGLSSPAILIVVIWCSVLACVAIGPIDYPGQPSSAVLALVATGVSLFILGHGAGAWCFGSWFKRRANVHAPSFRNLNGVVIATSLIGIGGIGLIALDRLVLSGVSNSGYSELLRCAPGLVDFIEIRRTPLLYIGYLTFSFGFASLALFLLKGEEIRGGRQSPRNIDRLSYRLCAALFRAHADPVHPRPDRCGHAGAHRPGTAAFAARASPPSQDGFIVLLFGIYSSAIWSTRQKFCVQVSGLIQEMQQGENKERDEGAGIALATVCRYDHRPPI